MKGALAVALCVVLWDSASAVAQGTAAPPTEAPKVVNTRFLPDGRLEITYADGTKSLSSLHEASLEPPKPPEWLTDADTNARFLAAMRAFYDYRTSGFEHRRRVFDWQLLSGRLIFATVLLLVGAGMVFAAIQFRVGLRVTPVAAPDGKPADAVTQIEIGATSVKVASPVLGVVILVISLAFFYLYLVYVYPIEEIL